MKVHLPCSQKLWSKVELKTTFVLESEMKMLIKQPTWNSSKTWQSVHVQVCTQTCDTVGLISTAGRCMLSHYWQSQARCFLLLPVSVPRQSNQVLPPAPYCVGEATFQWGVRLQQGASPILCLSAQYLLCWFSPESEDGASWRLKFCRVAEHLNIRSFLILWRM